MAVVGAALFSSPEKVAELLGLMEETKGVPSWCWGWSTVMVVGWPRGRERERFGSVYFREREEKKWKMKAERESEGEQTRVKRRMQ